MGSFVFLNLIIISILYTKNMKKLSCAVAAFILFMPLVGQASVFKDVANTLINIPRQVARALSYSPKIVPETGRLAKKTVLCPQEVKMCDVGGFVMRVPPNCEFRACPVINGSAISRGASMLMIHNHSTTTGTNSSAGKEPGKAQSEHFLNQVLELVRVTNWPPSLFDKRLVWDYYYSSSGQVEITALKEDCH